MKNIFLATAMILMSTTAMAQTVGDLEVKVGQMEETVRSSMGRVDELEHRIKTLEDRLEMINKDLDFRFKMLEEKSGTSAVQSQGGAAGGAGSAKDADIDALYQKGMDAVKAKNNQEAINSFTKIIQTNPKHKLAGNAQYWLGETYYVQKDYTRAAISFAKVYEDYRNGPKGADSLLKLGMSMAGLNKTKDACAAYVSLPTEFPRAEAGVKAKAAELAKKNACQ